MAAPLSYTSSQIIIPSPKAPESSKRIGIQLLLENMQPDTLHSTITKFLQGGDYKVIPVEDDVNALYKAFEVIGLGGTLRSFSERAQMAYQRHCYTCHKSYWSKDLKPLRMCEGKWTKDDKGRRTYGINKEEQTHYWEKPSHEHRNKHGLITCEENGCIL